MRNQKSINAVAAVTTVGALAWLYLFFNPRPARIDERPHRVAGEVLAAEAARWMQPGGRLFVISRAATSHQMPAAQAQLNGLMQALKKAKIKVFALRSLGIDPLRVTAVPPSEFIDLFRQSKENDVIISLLGPPILSADQIAQLGPKRPLILAMCSGATPARVNLKALFEQKLLTAAVVSLPDAPAQTRAGNARVSFDQMFKLITAANISELPSMAMTQP